jgi:hypothetical protein
VPTAEKGKVQQTMTASRESLYAVVDFESDRLRTIRRVVIPFPDARSADRFAADNSFSDYVVAPIMILMGAVDDAAGHDPLEHRT